MKCNKVLASIYGILVGIYFLGMFPFQLRELIALETQTNTQNVQYQECMRRGAHYQEALDYGELLNLQIRSYEKEFLNYETDYEAVERLRAFLSSYPLQALQVTKEGTSSKEYTGLTLKEETYRVTYKSSFYESYEVIQELLSITGASNLKSVMMTDLDKQIIKSDITFVLRLIGDIEDTNDASKEV